MLAASPGSARHRLRAALRLGVVFRRLAVEQSRVLQSRVLRSLLVALASSLPVRHRRPGLQPQFALRRAGLLPLGVGGSGLSAARPRLLACSSPAHHLLALLRLAVLLPDPVAELLYAVEVRVVQEGQEVSVPQPVLCRVAHAAPCWGRPRQDVAQLLCGDDLQVEAQQRLDEAVFHRLAVVDARVRLAQATDEEALVRPEQPLVQLDLETQKWGRGERS